MRAFFVILMFIFTELHFYQPDMDSYLYVIRNFTFISTLALLFFVTFNLMRKNKDDSTMSWKHFALISTLAIYQPIHFYVANITEIRVSYFLIATAVIYLYFCISYLLLNILLKNKYNSLLIAVIFTNLSIIIFSNFDINIFITLLILYFLSQIKIKKILPPILIFSSVLLILNLSLYVNQIYKIHGLKNQKIENKADIKNILTDKKPKNRDIYIIILDQYSGNNILKQKFGYDNSEFVEALKKEGFYVFDKMYSNYNTTFASIPSFINYEYMENMGYPSTTNAVSNATLFKIAKHFGYTIIYKKPPGGYRPDGNIIDIITYRNDICDIYKQFLEFNLFSKYFNNKLSHFDEYLFIKKQFLFPGNNIVFMHILAPHDPFLYDEFGNQNNVEEYKDLDNKYLPYLKYVNKQVIKYIKEIKQQSLKKPIIIITGDHGMRDYKIFESYFSTFSAYYNPEKKYDTIKDSKTLINFFINATNYEFGTAIQNKKDIIKYVHNGRNPVLEDILTKCLKAGKDVTKLYIKP